MIVKEEQILPRQASLCYKVDLGKSHFYSTRKKGKQKQLQRLTDTKHTPKALTDLVAALKSLFSDLPPLQAGLSMYLLILSVLLLLASSRNFMCSSLSEPSGSWATLFSAAVIFSWSIGKVGWKSDVSGQVRIQSAHSCKSCQPISANLRKLS